MSGGYLVVKLAAAGDVLLTTALARALRQARPGVPIAWFTSDYAATLLDQNSDLDQVFALPVPAAGMAARTRALAQWLPPLRRWRRQHADATVFLGHRSRALHGLLRAAGFRRIVGFDPDRPHRLEAQAAQLRAAGIAFAPLAPRLALTRNERAAGEQVWAPNAHRRWAVAPGGAANPWSAMPNRHWAPQRFLELAQEAHAAGIALRWLGAAGDVATVDWIIARMPSGDSKNLAGRLSLRETAAVCAAADLVIGNDSLPLVLAHALGRPALGLYGPTAGAAIHAAGQPYLQGLAGCGPCYQPREGSGGQAYTCPRARCMEQISVDDVWRRARLASLPRAEVTYA